MTILIPALAATYAAFCVWLLVRVINRRETWAKWTLAAAMIAGTFFALVSNFVWPRIAPYLIKGMTD